MVHTITGAMNNLISAITAFVKAIIALTHIIVPHLPKIILTLGVATCMTIVALRRPETIPGIIPDVFKHLVQIIK